MKFRRIRHVYDPRLFEYISNPSILKCESGFSFLREQCRVNPEYIENLSFWIHEFTEISILRILNRWKKKPFHVFVEFEGYKRTTIPHFISLYGEHNGRNLSPSTKECRW